MRRLVETLAAVLRPSAPPRVRSGGPELTLEHHRSIDALDPAEWDALLGDRGSFDVAGLRFLEETFGPGRERPEDQWAFHYYVVRDEQGAVVLATFLTAALWMDDMLAVAAVSDRVEQARTTDPYHLTSMVFGMGSLLTEGDHLYRDTDGNWRPALELLLEAVGTEALRAGAGTLVLRDLPGDELDLEEALRRGGYARTSMPDSLVLDPVAQTDAAWLARLSQRSRAHQRREVLAWDDVFTVEILDTSSRVPTDAELDHLHWLYRNVRDRDREINTFALPPDLWRRMLAHPCWELVLLALDAGAPPVAFGAHFKGPHHYAPMIVGLDYAYVRSHHSYRQALRQALLRARALGAQRVLLGMGAALEKQRFGAQPQTRRAYVQSADHYHADVLASLDADTASSAGISR